MALALRVWAVVIPVIPAKQPKQTPPPLVKDLPMNALDDMIEYVCDPHFGLSVNEAQLLWWSMQGIIWRPNLVSADIASEMATDVLNTRDTMLDIQNDGGVDPADPAAPADRRYEYDDLIEKLNALTPAKAAQLFYFMVGYLSAQRAAPGGGGGGPPSSPRRGKS